MPNVKPLKHFIPTPGTPGAMDRSEAGRRASALKSVIDTEGWQVFLDLIQEYQRHEQRIMMTRGAKEDNAAKERKIGEWRGMELAPSLVAGMIEVGEQASREMESGQVAEATN